MRKVALVGNPNSGKSSLFNVLTGLNQKVGNFPGVTVSRKTGQVSLNGKEQIQLIDLPGTYSLYPNSGDEHVACEVLRQHEHTDHPDLVVAVADATQLKRSLALATQLIDLEIPLVIALNMMDLAEKDQIQIDVAQLSKILDVPVIPVSALKEQGIPDLKEAIHGTKKASSKRILTIPAGFQPVISQLEDALQTSCPYLAYQALLKPEEFPQIDPHFAQGLHQQAHIENPAALISNELLVRYDRIDGILSLVEKQAPSLRENITQKLDSFLLHGVWGYVIFVALLFLIFQALFSWASYPMDLIDASFGSIGDWLGSTLPAHWASSLLLDGVIAGIGGIVIFVPQIAFLFLFIAILEESGYMSRVVFLMDRIMRPFGFSGRSVIPLVGGMACAVPSIMMARGIPNTKERLITIMVTPLMSCSARIPVYILLISIFVPRQSFLGIFSLQGVVMMGFYLLGFVMALLVAFVFKKALKYESDGIFVTEMPIYRMPRWKNVGITIYQKCLTFVTEAGKIILIISIVLWFLASYAPGNQHQEIEEKYAIQLADNSLSDVEVEAVEKERNAEKLAASYAGKLGKFIEPAIRPLGFDWKIGIALVTSFAAREVFVGTMATIYSVGDDDSDIDSLRQKMREEKIPGTDQPRYSIAVALSLLMFYAFAMQCMSTLAITKRETNSWKWTLVMLIYLTALAYVASFVTYQLASL